MSLNERLAPNLKVFGHWIIAPVNRHGWLEFSDSEVQRFRNMGAGHEITTLYIIDEEPMDL